MAGHLKASGAGQHLGGDLRYEMFEGGLPVGGLVACSDDFVAAKDVVVGTVGGVVGVGFGDGGVFTQFAVEIVGDELGEFAAADGNVSTVMVDACGQLAVAGGFDDELGEVACVGGTTCFARADVGGFAPQQAGNGFFDEVVAVFGKHP